MELRNHPVMFCHGLNVWPPKWVQISGPIAISIEGEVGVLQEVFLSNVVIGRLYLIAGTEQGNSYIGILPLEKASSTNAIFQFLYNHINKPFTIIGATDFP